MNKSELIDTLATRMAGDKKTASAAVEGLIDVVSRAVSKGEKVAITGFGVFEKRNRSARTARNPRTGATIKVKKTSVPAFRPGQQFKDVVSGAKKLAKVATPPIAKAAATTRTGKSTASSTPAKSTPAKPTAAKSTAAKSTTAKSTTAKSTAAKSTTAKSSAAKKAATTTAAKPAAKSTTKKTAAAKTSPSAKKVSTAARTLAKAPAAKAARKSTAKKTTAKKSS